ncbi:MAG TPA: hypothetical protein VMT53_17710 [Terriglobales bacterium]|nr:hypothetical protein [Terriglobales bacterium]
MALLKAALPQPLRDDRALGPGLRSLRECIHAYPEPEAICNAFAGSISLKRIASGALLTAVASQAAETAPHSWKMV